MQHLTAAIRHRGTLKMTRRGGSRYTFRPQPGEPYNAIVSIQYRGYKGDDFKDVSFSSRESVQRAIHVLKLDKDLSDMGLPMIPDGDCVFKSSLNYPLTLEVIFPDRMLGQVSSIIDSLEEFPRIRIVCSYNSAFRRSLSLVPRALLPRPRLIGVHEDVR